MLNCIFVTDLHGHKDRYEKLFSRIKSANPDVVLIGGDFLPNIFSRSDLSQLDSFINIYLVSELTSLKENMRENYPEVFIILGNDDPKIEEPNIITAEESGLLKYLNNKKYSIGEYSFYGYSYVPPSPFQLKDWEKYDVSRYVTPESVSPEEGFRTVEAEDKETRYSTIKADLEILTGNDELNRAVFLFHSPPYNTGLDYVKLKNKFIDDAEIDPHVGSVAIEKFIKEKKPMLTLHGHIHESATVTGVWKEIIGTTCCINGAYEGAELCIISFNLSSPCNAVRELI